MKNLGKKNSTMIMWEKIYDDQDSVYVSFFSPIYQINININIIYTPVLIQSVKLKHTFCVIEGQILVSLDRFVTDRSKY